jgi:hypothetical protein
MNKLVNGKIPANTECPWKTKCGLVQGCHHKGINHDIPFSCAAARGFEIMERDIDKHYRVVVNTFIGDRKVCNFLKSADLGITGAGHNEQLTLNYRVGEQVDEARVKKTMDAMITASNAQDTEFVVLGYEIVSIYLVE